MSEPKADAPTQVEAVSVAKNHLAHAQAALSPHNQTTETMALGATPVADAASATEGEAAPEGGLFEVYRVIVALKGGSAVPVITTSTVDDLVAAWLQARKEDKRGVFELPGMGACIVEDISAIFLDIEGPADPEEEQDEDQDEEEDEDQDDDEVEDTVAPAAPAPAKKPFQFKH